MKRKLFTFLVACIIALTTSLQCFAQTTYVDVANNFEITYTGTTSATITRIDYTGSAPVEKYSVPAELNSGDYVRTLGNGSASIIGDGFEHVETLDFSNMNSTSRRLTIASNAFRDVEIDYIDFVGTALDYIRADAFNGVKAEGVSFANSRWTGSVEKIEANAFYGADVKSISFAGSSTLTPSRLGTELFVETTVESLDFSDCIGLTYFQWNILGQVNKAKKLSEISFSGCTNLQFYEAYYYYAMFFDCNDLRRVDFSNCQLLSIPEYSEVSDLFSHALFTSTPNLQYVNLSGTAMTFVPTRLFMYKFQLETVILPAGLEEIREYAFFNCPKIKTLDIPTSVNTIGKWAFSGIEDLEYFTMDGGFGDFMVDSDGILYSDDMTRLVYYPSAKTDIDYPLPPTVETIDEGAFNGTKNLESITASSAHFMSEDGILYSADGKTLVRYPANKSDALFEPKELVTEIAPSAFYGVKNMREVVLGKTVGAIGDELFYNTNLEKITIKSTSITKLPSYALRDSRYLKEVNLPHSIVDLSNMAYAGLYSVESIVLPAKLSNIGLMTFYDCLRLDTITLLSSAIPELAIPPAGTLLVGVFSELLPVPVFDSFSAVDNAVIRPGDPDFPGLPYPQSGHIYFDFTRDHANEAIGIINKSLPEVPEYEFLVVRDWTGGPYLRIHHTVDEAATNSEGQSYQNILSDPVYIGSAGQELYYMDGGVLKIYGADDVATPGGLRGLGNTLSLIRFCFVEYDYNDNADPLESRREMVLIDNETEAEKLVTPDRPGYANKGWKNVERADNIGLEYFTDYMSTGVMSALRSDYTNPSDWDFSEKIKDEDLRLKAFYNPLVHLIIEDGSPSNYNLISIAVGDNEVVSGNNYSFTINSRASNYDAIVERKNVGVMSGTNGQYSLSNVVAPDTIIVRLVRNYIPTPNPEPDPDPDPNPRPTPESGIRIPGASPFCLGVDEFLLPFELLISGKTIYYSLEFSAASLAAGFENVSSYSLLPSNNIIPIKVPRNVVGGRYGGAILLQSDDITDLITRYDFSFDVEGDIAILHHPESISGLNIGDSFRLSVDATGTSLTYQWYHNGVKILGATSSTYTSTVTSNNEGGYSVVVSSPCYSLESDVASVSCCFPIKMKWDDVMYVDNSNDNFVSYQWYKDGSSIGIYGNAQYYTEEDGLLGTYFVRAYYSDGRYIESCPIVFNERTVGASATISPSLVARGNQFNVLVTDITSDTSGVIEIYDMGGRIVYKDKLSSDIKSISVDFTGGSYLVVVTLPSGKVEVKRLTVK